MTRAIHRCGRLAALCWLALAALPAAFAIEPDWSDYDALLTQYVKPGERFGIALNQVDYQGLARDARFIALFESLQRFDPGKLAGRAEKLAFYINAYNVFALHMVTSHLPLESIKDVGNFLRPVWKRTAGKLGGHEVTLDAIENERLRRLHEPRIHMAIVCASVSCPDLRGEAYRGAKLRDQLDEQSARFLANPGKGLRLDGRTAHVSMIFEWFAEDFERVGGVAAFIGRHAELPAGVTIAPDIEYDWRLNGS